MSGILLEINLKYIFGMLIYSLKHVQSYKYEKHLQQYGMKLQNISNTKAQLLATSDSYWTWLLQ